MAYELDFISLLINKIVFIKHVIFFKNNQPLFCHTGSILAACVKKMTKHIKIKKGVDYNGASPVRHRGKFYNITSEKIAAGEKG